VLHDGRAGASTSSQAATCVMVVTYCSADSVVLLVDDDTHSALG